MSMLDILRHYGLLLLVGQYPEGPVGGLAMTLIMAVIALAAAFPFALITGLARTSPLRPIALVAAAYTCTVRGLPLLLLIFWAYFAVPLLTGMTVSGATTVVCALIFYEGAYLGESIRAAIDAIPRGQMEAARSLGMTYFQGMRKIVLPQALYNAIPSILNQFILITKNTSLAYIIGTQEVTFSAYQINTQLLTQPFQVYVILAAIYFVLCFSLSRLANLVEAVIKRSRNTPREPGAQTRTMALVSDR